MVTVEVTQGASTLCPVCGNKGKKVPSETVPALVKPELRGAVREGPYRFCESPSCDVVYFSEADSQHQFRRSDLRVRVGQKESEPDRQVCYCFDWTAEDIERELRATGKTTIPDRIRRKVQAGFCQCETMNPQGSCCLGNVSKAAKDAERTLHGASGGARQPCDETGLVTSSSLKDSAAAPNRTARRRERGAVLATVGAVFSAVAASACCWLPLLLLAIGISGVGVAGIFEQYRPIFLTGTFALLGVAWYLTYRATIERWLARSPGTVAAGGAEPVHACCAVERDDQAAPTAESCCPTDAGPRRFGIRRFNKWMLAIATAVVLVFAFFPHWIGFVVRTVSGAERSASVLGWHEVRIEGMTCEGCAATLEEVIRKVPNVRDVRVSFRERRATIGVEPGRDFAAAEVLDAIEDAGYQGTLVEDASSSLP